MRPSLDFGPRYQVVREVGRGGLGRVLLVRDAYLEKELALKLLHHAPARPADLEQFQREFALLAALDHPGIARAHDFGYLGRRPFFTMEFVPGAPLSARAGAMDPGRLIAAARDLAEAVAFLHRGGILHLDLKPGNVIERGDDDRGRLVVVDFGLFRRGPARPGRTILGSLPYMAPELFRAGDLTPAADVYALGATLYRLATGRLPRPFRKGGGEPGVDWEAVPAPPSASSPGLPRDLDHILLRCLAVDPASRYPDAGEVLAALGSVGTGERLPARPAAVPVTVGRRAELDRLDRFLRGRSGVDPVSRSEGAPPVLLVTAAKGMGQTHFLREAKVRAQTLGIRFYLETGYPGAPRSAGSALRCLEVHMDPERPAERARWRAFLARLGRPRAPVREDTAEGERQLRRAGELALAVGCLRDPLVLAVDGLQDVDEVSVSLVADLARVLGERPARERPPIGLILGYREEGPAAPLLRDLTRYLLEPGKAETITLRPLEVRDALELWRHHGGAGSDALRIWQETGGSPAALTAGAPAGGAEADGSGERGASGPPGDGAAPRAGSDEREVLLALAILGRPASVAEIALHAGLGRPAASRLVRELSRAGWIQPADDRPGWVAGPSARRIAERLSAAERRRRHLRAARRLLEPAAGPDDPAFLEAVHHFRAAGSRAAVARHGLAAARWLKSTFQNRAALDLYRAVLGALPRRRSAAFLSAVLELAELPARLGDLDEGIRILREILEGRSEPSGTARARVLLRLATLYSRRGDHDRAGALFAEGFRLGEAGLSPRERLYFVNEQAAMQLVVGDHAAALDLADRGLRLAGGARSPGVREIVLGLHATRANVASRTFRYDRALEEYEECLRLAESLGTPAHRAGILNNLGIVYSNLDRHEDAIRSFRDAERTSLGVEEGPSLVSIYCNLAVLHAKVGDVGASERALAEAERLGPRSVGRRQEMFLRHAQGLCLLVRGRYAEARARLEAASELGRSTGDRFVAAFDDVYAAEALIFEGAYDRALRALSSEAPQPVLRRMALARRALLRAAIGSADGAEAAARERDGVQVERPVPAVEAWDRTHLGWALSIASLSFDGDRRERAREASVAHLEAARAFFREHGLGPAERVATWIRAEGLALAGDGDGALDLLGSGRPRGSDLASALWPLLEARIRLERKEQRTRCADLLSEAGAALVSNPLPEWAARISALRASLGGFDPSAGGDPRADPARGLPEGARRAYLESPWWKAWTSWPGAARPRARRRPSAAGREARTPTTPGTTPTAAVGAAAARASRRGLVMRSGAMRRLGELLDRAAPTDLPVLIQGETGTGKELVARIVHRESPRASGPFLVIDCATLPPGILEAELFGARAGSFTDLTEDRPGLLALAAGGTVLVDEIGGAAPEAQAKLLRVLSQGTFRRVGDSEERRADIRFLFATARDLEEEVRGGRFRADLLHRIRVLSIRVPPLRDRLEDIPDLVRLVLGEGPGAPPEVAPEALAILRGLPWPGNVRELRNVVERARLEGGARIGREAVERALGGPAGRSAFPAGILEGETLEALRERLERDYALHHLRRLGGDTTALSRFLGITRQQLYRRFRRLGIRLRPGEGRGGER